MERDAFEAAEFGVLAQAEELHEHRQRDEDAHSQLTGLRGTLWKLATPAAKAAVQGYKTKVRKYTNLNITSGVAPLPISAWGFAQRDLEKALPFKEMVTNANGEKQTVPVLEAAKMKDQWRRRVGLILLQENYFALRAYMTQNSSRWRPRGRGRTAGWSDEHD